jgi:hypothetical protein
VKTRFQAFVFTWVNVRRYSEVFRYELVDSSSGAVVGAVKSFAEPAAVGGGTSENPFDP